MSKEQINKFNTIVGNPPIGVDGTKDEIWEQLELQSRMILSEAQEMHDAALNRDIQEYLDGSEDVYFLREYADSLLGALDVDYLKARYEVNRNNSSKYTTSLQLATETCNRLNEEGVDCQVVATSYEGETYYVVKNKYGKVQKLNGHIAPDLKTCVPYDVKRFLGPVEKNVQQENIYNTLVEFVAASVLVSGLDENDYEYIRSKFTEEESDFLTGEPYSKTMVKLGIEGISNDEILDNVVLTIKKTIKMVKENM